MDSASVRKCLLGADNTIGVMLLDGLGLSEWQCQVGPINACSRNEYGCNKYLLIELNR